MQRRMQRRFRGRPRWRALGLLAAAAAALAALRWRQQAPAGSGYRSSPVWSLYDAAAQALDQAFGWNHLPVPLGLLSFIGLRNILRRHNLYDTYSPPAPRPAVGPPDPHYRTTRTVDGTYNDLAVPAMGMAGSRFGRNVPLDATYPEPDPLLLSPNPRTVSRELFTRETFQPAPTLNLLAGAWIQFMIRDWFSHGKNQKENAWQIPLQPDDTWPESPMLIPRTAADPTRAPGDTAPPTFINTETHWWDASQIYGSTQAFQTAARSGQDGKLIIGDDGRLPLPSDPERNPALVAGWWLGLAMMQTLFTLEHNAICDRLHAEYPAWGDEELFQRARLVNAALIAKIHTVDWTPALISHPTTRIAMSANWWGLAGEKIKRVFGRLGASEVISGIPGAETEHYGVPYSLTEEFVAVYRMHPLIRDEYSFRSAADDRVLKECTFREIAGPNAQQVIAELPMRDLFYSFGTLNPGAIRLHNFPRFLQTFERPDGHYQDLGATDILRTRERGVPRYNEFRRLLHLHPASSFESLTDNPAWAEEIRRVYDNDIERVDLLVGMYAERLPQGFAFSDTAFRIFILMASRRINSDRFLTRDFTPTVYSPAGFDWVNNNNMTTVLLRHYPQLRPALREVVNPFMPWAKTSA